MSTYLLLHGTGRKNSVRIGSLHPYTNQTRVRHINLPPTLGSNSMTHYYRVNDTHYTNKLESFRVALSQGHWPHWYFQEQEFSCIDWLHEPEQDLQTLYFHRAKKLREKYDYLICWFSGGSDSDNLIRSFLYQGLSIDEIWHRSSLENHQRRDHGTDPYNSAMETKLAVLPRLAEYKSRFPWWNPVIKINNLMSDCIQHWKTSGPRDPYSVNYYNPLLPGKEQSMATFKGSSRGKVAKLYGIDKPIVRYDNGSWYLVFIDDYMLTNDMSQKDPADNCDDIWFYWDPAAGDVLRKQAHIIVKYLKTRPDLIPLFDAHNHQPLIRQQADILIKNLIYPHWDQSWWQQTKISNNITHEEFYWFYQNHDHVAVENWRTTAKAYSDEVYLIYQSIQDCDKNFHTINGINILPSCTSKLYKIA
jgi:hypothetical protein